MAKVKVLTREILLEALSRLPAHDQLIVDWLKAEGFNKKQFEALCEPMEGRGELIDAGLRLRVASFNRSAEKVCVTINGTRFADIRGKAVVK